MSSGVSDRGDLLFVAAVIVPVLCLLSSFLVVMTDLPWWSKAMFIAGLVGISLSSILMAEKASR